jgi:hypothetical protein
MTDAAAGHETALPRLDRQLVRSIVSAVAVALVGVITLFVINLGATGISPERYRKVVEDAVRDGTMAATLRQPFAPTRAIYLVGGSDCLILGMLVTERDSPVRASISPRMPILAERALAPPAPGFGRDELCRILGWFMASNTGEAVPFLEIRNHHRYLHAPLTLATLLLAVVPFHAAEWLLLLACYAALAILAIAAAVRMRSPEPAEQRRALAFLIVAGVLAAFYALPVFGRTFAHAPTDIALVAFLLVGLLHPVCRLPERRFALIVSAFGTAIAMLELLTGGIPTGLMVLIALVALGGAPDAGTMWRRLVAGVACYGVAMATCFAAKLAAIAMVWGTGETAPLFDMLSSRMTGEVGSWPVLEQWVARFGFDADVIDRGAVVRRLLGIAMVTYSAFVLAWGSHVLGALLVIVPVPLLMVLTWEALRRVRRDQWLAQPQPVLLAASLVPFAWYASFPWHTITHSFFMVRPLAINVALAAVAAVMLPARRVRSDAVSSVVPASRQP